MPNIGPFEIAIVLIIALIVFGPKRLPELGRSLGKGINEFKEGISSIGGDDEHDDDDDDAPVEITASTAEPEVTEIARDDGKEVSGETADAEPVESEVVPERQD